MESSKAKLLRVLNFNINLPPALRTFTIVIAACLILSIIYFCNQFSLAYYFPIRTVHIYGGEHLSQTKVQDVLKPLVAKGYFNIKVSHIRDRLMQFTWVADIFVRRDWPDQVNITIVEKKPVAIWNSQRLLSDTGELFNPAPLHYPQGIAEFKGPLGEHMTMLQYFNNINRILLPLHVKISSLELSAYLTWKLTLDNGITLQLGRKDVLTRLNHFVKVYPKIVGQHAQDVDYIDLRYPNGIAIRWKDIIKT